MQIVTPNTKHWAQIAAEVLTNGGIVLHPTDTAYGLAVDATNEIALQKLITLKQRGYKPMILVVRNLSHARKYVYLNKRAIFLAGKYFPGALTLLVHKRKIIPNLVTAGLPNVGIRQPNHRVITKLSKLVEFPYTSTSANVSGNSTTYNIKDALDQLDTNQIDLVIDAGELPFRPTSTVVDTTSRKLAILREGAIANQGILDYK